MPAWCVSGPRTVTTGTPPRSAVSGSEYAENYSLFGGPLHVRAGEASFALGRSLAAGQRADFVLWDVAHPAQLSYAIGANPRLQTIFKGEPA